MSLFGERGVNACPPELELTRAISLGSTAALSAHLASCARCAALSRTLARPGELVRSAAPPPRSSAAREQTRTALLASLAAHRVPAHRTARGPRLLVLSFAAAAALLLAWRLAPRAPGADRGAPVVAGAPGLPDRATVVPSPVPEAQPVSRGATASPAAPAQVHGKSVAVKIAAERAVVARAPRADEPERGPSPAETAFVEAWTAFRAGRFASAAQGFGDAGRLDPTGPLSEDAAYWRAVALARTSATEASAALTDFVRRYPRSAHAPDASLLLERRGAATSPRAPAP